MLQQRLEDQDPILKELLRWTKIGAIRLRDILEKELATDQEKLVYEMSDGERGSRDVEKATGVNRVTVQRLWKKWAEFGIVEPSPRFQGRMQRMCSLRELAIRLPAKPSPEPAGLTGDTPTEQEGSHD